MPTRAELRPALERMSTPELLTAIVRGVANPYTDDALAVMREILIERGADPETAHVPVCPGCGHLLDADEGRLESRTGCLGFLFFGFGYQPTWYTSKGSREIVLRPRVPEVATRCKRCGLIMFGGRI